MMYLGTYTSTVTKNVGFFCNINIIAAQSLARKNEPNHVTLQSATIYYSF
jgi:hypothetical protein